MCVRHVCSGSHLLHVFAGRWAAAGWPTRARAHLRGRARTGTPTSRVLVSSHPKTHSKSSSGRSRMATCEARPACGRVRPANRGHNQRSNFTIFDLIKAEGVRHSLATTDQLKPDKPQPPPGTRPGTHPCHPSTTLPRARVVLSRLHANMRLPPTKVLLGVTGIALLASVLWSDHKVVPPPSSPLLLLQPTLFFSSQRAREYHPPA